MSSDIRGNTHSCVFDGLSTMVLDDSMVKILGWYDNEWGTRAAPPTCAA